MSFGGKHNIFEYVCIVLFRVFCAECLKLFFEEVENFFFREGELRKGEANFFFERLA